MPATHLGPFSVTARLGAGGMGVVHAAEHVPTGTPVAVKLLRRSQDRGDTTQARFADEVRAVARLDHPHVVQVYDHGVLTAPALDLPVGTPWLVMELAEASLAERVGEHGRPPLAGVVDLLATATHALAHAHAHGVLHRDVKPGNLLFAVDRAGRQRLILADFGIAAVAQRPDAVAGTPSWMAPEQFRPDGPLGPWTDLYAVGVLGWWLLTGTTPYGDGDWDDLAVAHRMESLPRLRSDAPAALRDLVIGLLAKEPGRRPTASAVLGELEVLTAPPPPRWAASLPAAPVPPVRLADAGLGLLGLRAPPFTAREEEREHLFAALAEAAWEGRARTVLLRAPSGIGKTRLATHFVRSALEEGLAGMSMLVRPGDDELGGALARALGLPASGSAHAFLADHPVAGRLARRDRVDLGDWLRGRPPGRPRDRVALVDRLLRASTGRGNALLVLDDLQDCADGLVLAEHLAAGPPTQVLVVATVRTDALADRPAVAARIDRIAAQDAVREVTVPPLDTAACRALLASALPLEDGLLAALAERAQGSSMLAVQLLATLAESGSLVRTERGWTAAALPGAGSLSTAWAASLDRVCVGDGDREALWLAAVLGPRVIPDRWRAACRAAGITMDPRLPDRLLRRGLAVRNEADWSFAHAGLREALLAEAGSARPRLHRIAADLLSDDVDRRDERLGRHLVGAGEFLAAVPVLLSGAKQRRRSGDYRGTLAVLDERDRARSRAGLETADPLGWMVRAEALLRLGNIDAAEALVDRAAAAAEAPAHVAEAAIRKGMILDRRGRSEDARAHLERGRALATELGERQLLGWAREQLSQVAMRRGRYAEAESLALEAAADYEHQGQLHGVSNCMLIAGVIAIKGGDAAAARPRFERLLELSVAANLRTNEGHARMNLGEVARMLGDLDAAAAHYAEAELILEPTGGLHALFPRLNRALVQVDQGATEEALPVLLRVAEEFARRERALLESTVRLGLLRCYGARGDGERWDAALARACAVLATTDELDREVAELAEAAGRDADQRGWPDRARAAWALAELHWRALGRTDDAARVARLSRDPAV